MDIILIAGLWLPHTIWDEVARELAGRGHRPIPVALPGVDDGPSPATLDDQLTAALAVVDRAERPLVVGHSAACTLAWLVADRRPDDVAGVVMIGGFPASSGERYADFFPIAGGVMPFPGWEPFAGPDASDLDAAQRTRIAAGAIPVAEGVALGMVELRDEKRFDLPVLLVCPEYSPEQARTWIEGGEVPELSGASAVSYSDIGTGHWPMVTQPAALAEIIDAAANP